jgi:type II secretory ATPase GspE/PulE/Tfp pilus assembly ATPase PilB-like protein
MVGEIRDGETAGMATQAALTGHLVLSTLHTNDSAGALPRLTNMGIEPFLITSSINLIIAQRLVRRVCPDCKVESKMPESLITEIKTELAKIPKNNPKDLKRAEKPLKFYHGTGCPKCSKGHKGRVGIYEVIRMTEQIEELVVGHHPASDIKNAAISDGMITMKQDGIIKAMDGLITLDEVFQATVG